MINQNLHPVNLNQNNNNKFSGVNTFSNTGPSYPMEERKKVGFESIKFNNENSVNQLKTHNKILTRPFVTNVIPISNSKNEINNNKDFLNKIRRRSIKNNKIVFCHAQKSVARKFVTEVKVKIKFYIF